jgi:MerR family transcriptional regulator, light-induced transcriptional regulator
MSPTTDTGTLSLHEVAARLDVHYMTAYRYVRTGMLDATQEGGQWRVTPAALASLRTERRKAGATRGRRAAGPRTATDARRVTRLTDRMLAGDPTGAWKVVESALAAGTAPTAAYTELLTPALRRVGDRWEKGVTSIGEEHRATAVASRLVGRLGARCARPGRTRGTVVLAGAPGDRHGLATAILADLLRAEHLTVTDLGADAPADEVAAIAAGTDRLIGVGICATTPLDRARERELRRAVRSAREHAPGRVLLGGAAVASAEDARRLGADGWTARAQDAVHWFTQLEKP